MSIKLDPNKLQKFMQNILVKVGMKNHDANIVSDSLVFANLRGIDSHGVIRFPFYLKRLIDGGTNIQPKIKIIYESAASILLDGDNGMGQVVGVYAVNLAIRKSKENGFCFIGVKGSSHFGAAQYYTNQIAKENLIGFSITSTGGVMVPWGGSKRMIGNNPFSIAVPYLKNKTLVLDISMSKVAGGKVRLAAKDNIKIPLGWIVNKNGEMTENPNDLGSTGALLPLGEYKGYGMAFMIEILCSALTGAAMLGSKPSWIKDTKTPLNMGHCFAAMNIEMFMDISSFRDKVKWMIHKIKSTPLAKNFSEILVPGEKEWRIEEDRKKHGIPISEEIWLDLVNLANKYKEILVHE